MQISSLHRRDGGECMLPQVTRYDVDEHTIKVIQQGAIGARDRFRS